MICDFIINIIEGYIIKSKERPVTVFEILVFGLIVVPIIIFTFFLDILLLPIELIVYFIKNKRGI